MCINDPTYLQTFKNCIGKEILCFQILLTQNDMLHYPTREKTIHNMSLDPVH